MERLIDEGMTCAICGKSIEDERMSIFARHDYPDVKEEYKQMGKAWLRVHVECCKTFSCLEKLRNRWEIE